MTRRLSTGTVAESVTAEDFAESFGTTVDDLGPCCTALINQLDFQYRTLQGEERDRVILRVLERIEDDTQKVGSPERKDAWERGWSENLDAFRTSGDEKELVPKFIRPGQVIRFKREYIEPSNPTFELDYYRVFRLWLFEKYLEHADAVYELGCGTGFNLVALAERFPGKTLFGLDFASAAVDLVNTVARTRGLRLTGVRFDMVSPDETMEFRPRSAVFTIGSVEQLAGRVEKLLQFLIRRAPVVCVNVEPTIELYDPDTLIDYLAMQFHRKRGYTEGYLPRLRDLEAQGVVEILKVKRLFFGSLLMEGFSYVVWRPVAPARVPV